MRLTVDWPFMPVTVDVYGRYRLLLHLLAHPPSLLLTSLGGMSSPSLTVMPPFFLSDGWNTTLWAHG